MGLLTKINSSELKSAAADKISGGEPPNLASINWGLLGNFAFGVYSWVEQFQSIDEDEYIEYRNLGGRPKKERLHEKNTVATLSFQMFQRDLNIDEQNEEQMFEEDIIQSLSYLYDQKKREEPLPLLKNGGEFLVGYFAIKRIEWNEIDTDNKGLPMIIQINLELEGYPRIQVTK